MDKEAEKAALENSLKYFGFDEKYIIFPTADGRIKHKYALAIMGEHGSVHTQTAFMTYDVFNVYLTAYDRGKRDYHK